LSEGAETSRKKVTVCSLCDNMSDLSLWMWEDGTGLGEKRDIGVHVVREMYNVDRILVECNKYTDLKVCITVKNPDREQSGWISLDREVAIRWAKALLEGLEK
jgi:hypothetical protein